MASEEIDRVNTEREMREQQERLGAQQIREARLMHEINYGRLPDGGKKELERMRQIEDAMQMRMIPHGFRRGDPVPGEETKKELERIGRALERIAYALESGITVNIQ